MTTTTTAAAAAAAQETARIMQKLRDMKINSEQNWSEA